LLQCLYNIQPSITDSPGLNADTKMKNNTLQYLKDMYLMPFRAIASGIRLFARNRNRMREFISQPVVAKILRYAMLLTLFIWLALALLAKDEEKNRLTDAVKELWPKKNGDSSQTDATTINNKVD
jgi:hypothetical protein